MVLNPNFFYKAFFYGFFFNYFIIAKYDDKKLKLDLFIKYILLFLKSFKNFILFIIIKILKMFYYTIFFILDTIKAIYDFIKPYIVDKFNTWKPLFKKHSYFGYFRNFKNKWFK